MPEPKDTPEPKDSRIFLTQIEYDEFLNSERGKIRDQEETKFKNKISDLQEKLKTKGDSSMTEDQIAKVVQDTVSAALSKYSTETSKRYDELKENVTNDAKSRKIERLQDIIESEKGRYKPEELIESMIPSTITGDETPEQIRAAFAKSHEEYNKIAAKFKIEEKPKEEKKPETKETPANPPGGSDIPGGKIAAPGVGASSGNDIPPALDTTTQLNQKLDEMNSITDPKEWAEKRKGFAKLFGVS